MNQGLFDDFKSAWSKPNNAVAQIILINVIIFIALLVLQIALPATIFQQIHKHFVIPPAVEYFIYRPYTIITYAFTHSLSRVGHILFNMLAFFWFGRLINEYLGSKKVISIYVLGALGGAMVYLLSYNLVPEYHNGALAVLAERVDWGMVGASAAVYAIVVAAAVKLPDYTFFLFFFGPVKIKYIALFYVVLSLVGINAGDNTGGNIAHLGGAFMGWLYISQLAKGTDIGAWVVQFISFTKSMFAPQPKIKVTHRNETKRKSRKASQKSNGFRSSGSSAEPAQSEIDAILDKISQYGYESLSTDEKQKLFNASKK